MNILDARRRREAENRGMAKEKSSRKDDDLVRDEAGCSPGVERQR